VKERYIRKINQKHNMAVKRKLDSKSNQPEGSKRKLESALFQALEWQRSLVAESTIEVNCRSYVGPHKWIICLLGHGNYYIKQFLNDKGEFLREQDRLSISVLGLSVNPFSESEAKNMSELTCSTSEGVFANITR